MIAKSKWKKFKEFKKGYYSLIIFTFIYILSFLLPVFVNNIPLLVKFENNYFFPLFNSNHISVLQNKFNQNTNFRNIKKQIETSGNGFVIMPLYPFNPDENLLEEIPSNPPTNPDSKHWFGTDDRGRDVFARVLYGFNVSLTFSLIVTIISFLFGILVGAISGYIGSFTDLFVQRLIEIWSSLPLLYLIIVVSSFVNPDFWKLTFLLIILSWTGITFYIRGEVLREKSNDYVLLARSAGLNGFQILVKHILPKSLTPAITFFPFALIANTLLLVALDFLGFGMPPPVSSWGQLIQQGMFSSVIDKWWLVVFPLSAQFLLLLLIVFIGEAVKNTFDPKFFAKYK